MLTAIYYIIQRSRDLPSGLVTEKLLLFVLFFINVVLILTIVFVFGRNLFKLIIERQHGILGSRFKTKLLVTFVGLALLPVRAAVRRRQRSAAGLGQQLVRRRSRGGARPGQRSLPSR